METRAINKADTIAGQQRRRGGRGKMTKAGLSDDWEWPVRERQGLTKISSDLS